MPSTGPPTEICISLRFDHEGSSLNTMLFVKRENGPIAWLKQYGVNPTKYGENKKKEQQAASDNGRNPHWHEGTRGIVLTHESLAWRPQRVSN